MAATEAVATDVTATDVTATDVTATDVTGGAVASGAVTGRPPTDSGRVSVRYFAAAAEAAGTPGEVLVASTVGELRAAMADAHGAALVRVLARCSLLADGVLVDADDLELSAGLTVDVLPPFAGG